MQQSYIAIDIETTGLDVKRDRITEIGAIRVENGAESAQFHTLVNPHRMLEPRIVKLTGITDEMLTGAPDVGEVIGELVAFCGDLPLLGHHILFDYRFLKQAAINQRLTFEKNGIDTLTICRRMMPKEEKKNLENACAYFGVPREQAHRALGDARDAHRLFLRLCAAAKPEDEEAFLPRPLTCRVKREQPATKRQKEGLRYLLKYHKIELPVQIDDLSRSEVSRYVDRIILHYGRIPEEVVRRGE